MRKNHFYPSIRFMNLLFLLLFFAGCSKESDDNTPHKAGDFTLKTTGNESFDYKGEATFVHTVYRESTVVNGTLLQIIFDLGDDNTFFITMGRYQAEYFQKGKYIFVGDSGDDIPVIISSTFHSSKHGKIYFITNGFVELEKVEKTLLTGNFKIDYMSEDDKKITVAGSFSASDFMSTP